MKQGNILAFSDYQANRIRRILLKKNLCYRESASFGYLSFIFDDRFLFALKGDNLEIKLHPDHLPDIVCPLSKHEFIIIDKFEYNTEDQLEYWIDYVVSPLCPM